MSIEKETHPFLNDLSPNAELRGTVLRQPIKGGDNISQVVSAVGTFYKEQRTIYTETVGLRSFIEYEADLHSGVLMRAIVVVERGGDGLVSQVSVRVEPLGAALTIAENLAPILGSLV